MYCLNCGKQIPDESKYCLHCGTLIKKDTEPTPDYKNQNPIADGSMRCLDCKADFLKIYKRCPKCGSFNKITAKVGERLPKGADLEFLKRQSVKCPACGSKNVDKISLTNKIASGAVFSIFAIGHIAKTFKCENCGYKW